MITDKNIGYKYGYRGTHDAVYHLSPYQFTSEWEIQRVTYPYKHANRFSTAVLNIEKQLMESPYHTKLTVAGKEKLRADEKADLHPGVDYKIHGDEGITDGCTWVAFPESATTLRHEYVMVRRLCPVVPKFQGMDGAP